MWLQVEWHLRECKKYWRIIDLNQSQLLSPYRLFTYLHARLTAQYPVPLSLFDSPNANYTLWLEKHCINRVHYKWARASYLREWDYGLFSWWCPFFWSGGISKKVMRSNLRDGLLPIIRNAAYRYHRFAFPVKSKHFFLTFCHHLLNGIWLFAFKGHFWKMPLKNKISLSPHWASTVHAHQWGTLSSFFTS